MRERYDVVVVGGGLAGLCLALQLRRARPETSILVVERRRHPLPEAAHKVGESSVEIGSHYFSEVLGLGDLLDAEIRKFGLRFFMSHDGNRDITTRLECGPSEFLFVPSYQIDRGRFETELARRALELGVHFVHGRSVDELRLGEGRADHVVSLDDPEEAAAGRAVRCRWIVDASGRSALLKKQLGLGLPNRHEVNAAWFRIDHPIDPDDWSDDPAWRARNRHSRRLSTNHLMGEGYWVWLIPLAIDRTSVGIVSDERLHPFAELHSFPAALAWLDRHEPQLASVVRAQLDKKMDFHALKGYSHGAKQVFSGDRWCLVGDSGWFIDPLYSPGSDFIGIANGFCCDLIGRDLGGDDVRSRAVLYDESFRSLARTFLLTYRRQYPLMGSPAVMSAKVVWDFAMYWGGIALLYFRGKFNDPVFMERVQPILQGFARQNVGMQGFFRHWAEQQRGVSGSGVFVDYSGIPFLADLNRRLLEHCDDDELLEQLEHNLRLAVQLRREIVASASRVRPATSHLSGMFAAT